MSPKHTCVLQVPHTCPLEPTRVANRHVCTHIAGNGLLHTRIFTVSACGYSAPLLLPCLYQEYPQTPSVCSQKRCKLLGRHPACHQLTHNLLRNATFPCAQSIHAQCTPVVCATNPSAPVSQYMMAALVGCARLSYIRSSIAIDVTQQPPCQSRSCRRLKTRLPAQCGARRARKEERKREKRKKHTPTTIYIPLLSS